MTTASAPKVGDRVRVTIEGEVLYRWADVGIEKAQILLSEDEDWAPTLPVDGTRGVSVEVLAPHEPEWQPGDVVLAGDGKVYVRHNHTDGGAVDFPWSHAYVEAPSRPAAERFRLANRYADTPLARPLTLLVRDGKPVQS